MKNIFLFGECMIELMAASPDKSSSSSSNTMAQSFAGDVFNTGVYLKRAFAETNVHLVTAVGQDSFSHDMINYFHQEKINTDYVFRSEDKIPGLYAIQTDELGERSFTYWRENSAARQTVSFITDAVLQKMKTGDLFFFSGISLAVIEPEFREAFWQCLIQLKTAGVNIVFDPNFRARMWESTEEAKKQFEQAFELSDILLPGIEDFQQLYQLNTFEEVKHFCQGFQIDELVIKNGPDGVLTIVDGVEEYFTIEPASHVVDTTSAGDSFNGIYLGSRLDGMSVSQSIEFASQSAALVIQHKGAIVEREIFSKFLMQRS
jgi:2-dehydro-3-deoxygluconokinase